jgi:hypothetical protein
VTSVVNLLRSSPQRAQSPQRGTAGTKITFSALAGMAWAV